MTFSANTYGIEVTVEPEFVALRKSDVLEYVFSYSITIANNSDAAVQLISRHWFIQNAHGDIREVVGEGVLGKQPVIEVGTVYSYQSWAPIDTPMGKMWGIYTVFNLDNQTPLVIEIPCFDLRALALLN